MTTFPQSPRLIKGALAEVEIANPLASVVVFQSNLTTTIRRLEARSAWNEGDPGETTRLRGPPKEAITFSVDMDTTDLMGRAIPRQSDRRTTISWSHFGHD